MRGRDATNQENQQRSTSTQKVKKVIGNYQYDLQDKIGSGFSSSVYKGLSLSSNANVAIKVIDLNQINTPISKTLLKNEVHVLRQLNHPNLLRVFDIYNTQNNTYIITELCNQGDLADLIHKHKRLNENKALEILNSVLQGMKALQSQQILHRDIKPANILMSDGIPKLADFGFAVNQTQQLDQSILQNFNVGTPLYMSPETILYNQYSEKSDIWALGIVLYEMVHGFPPYKAPSDSTLLNLYLTTPISFSTSANLSPKIKTLISNMLMLDIKQRYGIQETIDYITPPKVQPTIPKPQQLQQRVPSFLESTSQNKFNHNPIQEPARINHKQIPSTNNSTSFRSTTPNMAPDRVQDHFRSTNYQQRQPVQQLLPSKQLVPLPKTQRSTTPNPQQDDLQKRYFRSITPQPKELRRVNETSQNQNALGIRNVTPPRQNFIQTPNKHLTPQKILTRETLPDTQYNYRSNQEFKPQAFIPAPNIAKTSTETQGEGKSIESLDELEKKLIDLKILDKEEVKQNHTQVLKSSTNVTNKLPPPSATTQNTIASYKDLIDKYQNKKKQSPINPKVLDSAQDDRGSKNRLLEIIPITQDNNRKQEPNCFLDFLNHEDPKPKQNQDGYQKAETPLFQKLISEANIDDRPSKKHESTNDLQSQSFEKQKLEKQALGNQIQQFYDSITSSKPVDKTEKQNQFSFFQPTDLEKPRYSKELETTIVTMKQQQLEKQTTNLDPQTKCTYYLCQALKEVSELLENQLDRSYSSSPPSSSNGGSFLAIKCSFLFGKCIAIKAYQIKRNQSPLQEYYEICIKQFKQYYQILLGSSYLGNLVQGDRRFEVLFDQQIEDDCSGFYAILTHYIQEMIRGQMKIIQRSISTDAKIDSETQDVVVIINKFVILHQIIQEHLKQFNEKQNFNQKCLQYLQQILFEETKDITNIYLQKVYNLAKDALKIN